MIIECTKAISDATGKDLGNDSPWLKIGKQYIVYAIRSINTSTRTRVTALIESENYQDPGFFDLNQFTIVSSKLPSTWIVSIEPDGGVAFMPKSWVCKSFWDAVGENDLAELELFHKEKELILQEEPEFYKNMNNS